MYLIKTSSFSEYSASKPILVVNDFNAGSISDSIDFNIGLVGIEREKGGTSYFTVSVV
jgi:hypothetical protein